MNGGAVRAALLLTALASCPLGTTSVDFLDCPSARCEFGTLRGPIATLADLNAMGIPPPQGMCKHTIASVVFGGSLPPGCGSTFSKLQTDFARVCNTSVTGTYVGICGSSQGNITNFLVAYTILYTFVLLLGR